MFFNKGIMQSDVTFLFEVIMAKRRRRHASKRASKRGKRKIKKRRHVTRKYRIFSSRFPHRSLFKSKHLR